MGALLYEHVGGVACAKPGFEAVRIQPRPAPGVTWARTWVNTVRGRIECGWRAGRGGLAVDIGIPPGVDADVVLPAPAAGIEEGGRPLRDAPGVRGAAVI